MFFHTLTTSLLLFRANAMSPTREKETCAASPRDTWLFGSLATEDIEGPGDDETDAEATGSLATGDDDVAVFDTGAELTGARTAEAEGRPLDKGEGSADGL